MIQRFLALAIAICFCNALNGQTPYKWWNPAGNSFPVIEGQLWPQELAARYDRLPARAEKTVTTNVWNLSHQAAGLLIRFQTDAPEITVRYAVKMRQAMPHMPATGVSGVDLYALDKDGNWLWAAGKYNFADTITYQFTALNGKAREYRLYLPLYNEVSWMEIGIPEKAVLTPLPVRKEKPVVIYGTSIAQGACASRPGMAWTALLERLLDRPVVNLGFSGNGRLEPGMMELLCETDAKLYVLDCLPNLSGFPPQEVKQRMQAAIKMLREKKGEVPILLTAHSNTTMPLLDTVRHSRGAMTNRVLDEVYDSLQKAGAKNIYKLPAEEIGLDMNSTVDGSHPNDAGMMAYANAYEKSIRNILQEPVGQSSTTRPCRQYREPQVYNWDARHEEILAMNKTSPPGLICIGNSITHYWGGLPKAPHRRGTDSWDKVFAPLNARNLGFGWDRIENALWRVYHDELDSYRASTVLLLIGTNNLAQNNDAEIKEGLSLLIKAVRQRQPQANILLCGLLPRTNMGERITPVNKVIAGLAAELKVQYVDPGKTLLTSAGKIDTALFSDGVHPNEEGYRKLGAYLQRYLSK
jgi:lysophospholipase L1-like esterase